MISEKMRPLVQNNSAIREMFEEGGRLKAKYGADKVFDFSLGNPNVPAPKQVKEAVIDLITNEDPVVLHGYMSNAGFEDVRKSIAESLNRRFGTSFQAKNLIMTVGAASGLNVILKTVVNPGEEVIVFAPYFLEYGSYVRNYDGKLVEVSPDFYRPTDVVDLWGDPSKAKRELGWNPAKTSFEDLVRIMTEHDMERIRKESM